MSPEQLESLKCWVRRFWLFSPERLWRLSIATHKRGHWVLAFWIKQLNTLLYHNSLAPGASVRPDISLGHNSIGIVISDEVDIGREVMIWHNVTLVAAIPGRRDTSDQAGGSQPGHDADPTARRLSRIVIEDGARIGAGAIVIAARGSTLRIGRGARIGAGTVVTRDVPPWATVVGQAPRVLSPPASRLPDEQVSEFERPD
jgi:serine O-acetyltransferase